MMKSMGSISGHLDPSDKRSVTQMKATMLVAIAYCFFQCFFSGLLEIFSSYIIIVCYYFLYYCVILIFI